MQSPASGSPLLFQQNTNSFPGLNPLLQPPTSAPQLSSPLIQSPIRLASAFTPLNPANTQQTSSLIQPKLTIGNQPSPLVSPSQPVQFPLPKPPTTQRIEPTTTIPSSTQDFSFAQHDSQLASPSSLPPPSAIKDPNQALPPPPSHIGACKEISSPYLGKKNVIFYFF